MVGDRCQHKRYPRFGVIRALESVPKAIVEYYRPGWHNARMSKSGEPTPASDRRAVALLIPALAFQALRKVGTIYDSDTWWHLATGRLILERKAIPRVDPFSWTAAGETWQPNGWLSDAFLAVVEKMGGLPLVALLRPTFMVLIGIVVYAIGRRTGAGPWSAVAAAALAVFFAEPFVVERPQLFSFVLLPVVVISARSALRGSTPALIGTIALTALWANLHGVFVVGVGVVGLLALGYAVDRRTLLTPLKVAGGAALAGLVSPLFWRGYMNAVVRAVGFGDDQRMAISGPGQFE